MEPVIRVENVVKRQAGRGLGRRVKAFTAVDSVSFSILPGTTLALVGESGSGKSSLALCLAGLERVTSGRIWFEGRDLAALEEKELRMVRPRLQLVFQDPANSLNPRWTVGEIVAEPLLVQSRISEREGHARAAQALERVGLAAEYLERKAQGLSGGQRQRVAIAHSRRSVVRARLFDSGADRKPARGNAASVWAGVSIHHARFENGGASG